MLQVCYANAAYIARASHRAPQSTTRPAEIVVSEVQAKAGLNSPA
jgi:hypothetical protein